MTTNNYALAVAQAVRDAIYSGSHAFGDEQLLEIIAGVPRPEPVALDHIACIDDGVLRYMSGRKAPEYDCELYAMPKGERAPKLYTEQPAQLQTQQPAEPVNARLLDCNAAHMLISGALFDFMGWLTSRKTRLVLSASDNASPAVAAIKEFATLRELCLDEAAVLSWNESIAAAERQQAHCQDCGSLIGNDTIHTCSPLPELSDEQIDYMARCMATNHFEDHEMYAEIDSTRWHEFARAVIAADRELRGIP